MTTYFQGYEAARLGQSWLSNPYQENSGQWFEWNYGFESFFH